jgi:hypothetical protein
MPATLIWKDPLPDNSISQGYFYISEKDYANHPIQIPPSVRKWCDDSIGEYKIIVQFGVKQHKNDKVPFLEERDICRIVIIFNRLQDMIAYKLRWT